MTVIRWEDPPERRNVAGPGGVKGKPQRDWRLLGAELRARPKRWALIEVVETASTAGTLARAIRLGERQRLGAGFEAVSRSVDGEHRIYARYVGGQS